MLNGLILRSVVIVGLIVTGTVLLAIAVSMQDHFLVFVALMICIGLVGMLFRGKPDDRSDERNWY